jgi:hypothetical protein
MRGNQNFDISETFAFLTEFFPKLLVFSLIKIPVDLTVSL